ncbi:MAG: hemerythrin domain-containing protein [Phycisphaerales bacterium]|nr:hemerythrin domain-containing protein [Phycisphaerales bacterium]
MGPSLNILGNSPHGHDHGFDEPIGLLTDCHRRIERFLDILQRVAREYAGAQRPLDAQALEAVRKARAYFAHAAPRHTADEEESLFPRVRAAVSGGDGVESDGAGRSGPLADLDRLHADHERADALHARVDGLLTAWLRDGVLPAGQATELGGLLGSLGSLYREHIHIEESAVFPLAGRVLSADELTRIGAEMRDRRGLTPRA